MNAETISMDPGTARERYQEYLASVRRHREKREATRLARAKEIHKELYKVRVEKTQMEKEDELLRDAYRELANGNLVIDVCKAIVTAGLNDQLLPNLAICRADSQRCRIQTQAASVLRFNRTTTTYRPLAEHIVDIRVSSEMYEKLNITSMRQKANVPLLHHVSAIVPTIPPHLRPEDPENYFILWEAVWDKTAPVDPFLLKKLNDVFYVVVAEWDLTEVERAVLESRVI